jgi:hypothetical protein
VSWRAWAAGATVPKYPAGILLQRGERLRGILQRESARRRLRARRPIAGRPGGIGGFLPVAADETIGQGGSAPVPSFVAAASHRPYLPQCIMGGTFGTVLEEP